MARTLDAWTSSFVYAPHSRRQPRQSAQPAQPTQPRSRCTHARACSAPSTRYSFAHGAYNAVPRLSKSLADIALFLLSSSLLRVECARTRHTSLLCRLTPLTTLVLSYHHRSWSSLRRSSSLLSNDRRLLLPTPPPTLSSLDDQQSETRVRQSAIRSTLLFRIHDLKSPSGPSHTTA